MAKRRFVFLVFFFFLLNSPSVWAQDSCTTVAQGAINRISERNNTAIDLFDSQIQTPSMELLDACLDGFSLLKMFSMGIDPSFFNIDICNIANEFIADRLVSFQQSLEFEPIPGFSFGVGGGIKQTENFGLIHATDVRVDNNARERVEQMSRLVRRYRDHNGWTPN